MQLPGANHFDLLNPGRRWLGNRATTPPAMERAGNRGSGGSSSHSSVKPLRGRRGGGGGAPGALHPNDRQSPGPVMTPIVPGNLQTRRQHYNRTSYQKKTRPRLESRISCVQLSLDNACRTLTCREKDRYLWFQGSICRPQRLHRKCLHNKHQLKEVHCLKKKKCSVGTEP